MALAAIAYPEWTDYREKGGLDPLGMQNSSINLYQRLLPGISNVTLRVRYYGLYAWLAAIYARRSRSTDLRKWQQLIRRAEALYALAAVHGKDEGGVSGSRWARRKLAASTGRISFAEHADPDGSGLPYLQQKWGAYGAAYVGDVLRLTLLAPDIVEMILDGRQPPGLQFERFRKSSHLEWQSQRNAISGGER